MQQDRTKNSELPNRQKFFVLLIILLVTVISFWSSLKNNFTNWDDDFHITQNASVQMPTLTALKPILTTTVNHTYIPLTEISFNIEYQFFKFNPKICHTINLILHLAVVGIIFYFGLEIGLPLVAAAIGTLIFAIHPMHVESVAWLTQRKDLLYSLFYMLSLYFYWHYCCFRLIQRLSYRGQPRQIFHACLKKASLLH